MNNSTPDWLQSFDAALLKLDDDLRSRKSSMDLSDAADAIVALNRFKESLKIIHGELSGLISSLMTETQTSELQTTDGSTIERKGDVSRTGWKHKDLAQEVISRLTQMSINMDTGEVMESGPEMAMRMLDFVQPSYWRIGALSSIGINADDYSKVGEYKENIIIRKAKN